jgi:hypothetical protein
MEVQKEKFDIESPSFSIIQFIFVMLFGLILPLLLIPLVKITGYSEVVEELVKVLVILFLILKLPNTKTKILAGIIFGFLFGLSENFLFLNQIFQSGNLGVFFERFLWTVPMHIITVLIMVFTGMSKKWLLIFGFISAIILHILFNFFAVSILI